LTTLVAQLAREFNLEVELENIILVTFRFFEFLHSQGQKQTSTDILTMSASPPEAVGQRSDIGPFFSRVRLLQRLMRSWPR
jgi:hypothetical protein